MIRFSHTVFALPFALLAAVMAWHENATAVPLKAFSPRDLLGILVCMVTARSAAMAFNRLADRKIDAENPRTRGRHLPSGLLTVKSVVLFWIVCSAGFIMGTLLFLPRNPIPLYASVPVLVFLFAYSYTKRITWLSHFWLGGALMLAPLAAWVAIRGELAWPPVVLGAAVLCWVAGFDIIYACQDVDFDRAAGLFSIPARLGVKNALKAAAGCHAATAALLFALPLVFPPFGALYCAGTIAIAALLIYEHALVCPDDLARVNVAFFHVNAVVSIGLFLIGSADMLFF